MGRPGVFYVALLRFGLIVSAGFPVRSFVMLKAGEVGSRGDEREGHRVRDWREMHLI